MRLLAFSVDNFLSINETQTIDFVKGSFGTSPLPKGGWASRIRPVTMILGANAAGKSNLLSALALFATVIGRQVQNLPGHPRHVPFLFDSARKSDPSLFELDFWHEDNRYRYGFGLDSRGYTSEYLHKVNRESGYWNRLFDREVCDGINKFAWRPGLVSRDVKQILQSVTPRELVLPFAARLPNTLLGKLALAMESDFVDFIPTGEKSRENRRSALISMIKQGEFRLDELSSLLSLADTGITDVELDEKQIPSEILEKMRRIKDVLEESAGSPSGDHEELPGVPKDEITQEEAEHIAYGLVFTHQGSNGVKLKTVDESDGTLAWLAYSPAILQVLRSGGVLVADELDASLHQRLVELIVKAFADPVINRHQAQLIFSTHNTNLLEYMKELNLKPDAFWFVEKDAEGASQVFTLDSFEKHKNANYESRYRAERYGAIPNVSIETLCALVLEGTEDGADMENNVE